MQPVLDGPRLNLNPDQVESLLQGDPTIEITYGCYWYDATMVLRGDLQPYMIEGSSIQSDSMATVHRSCTLNFSSDVGDTGFDYLTCFVKPYMVLTNPDTGFTAQFNLGVYVLSTPEYDNSVTPTALAFQGYDLLYLLDQPIGDSLQIDPGEDPVAYAASLVGAAWPPAEVQYEDTTEVLASEMTWPLDESDQYTYLDVINALLVAAGYAPLWVDWDGNFQIHAYVSPYDQNIEWTFDLGANDNIVAEERTSDQDLFDVPNWWRFIETNLTDPPEEGVTQFTYVDTTGNPGSYNNRQRYVKKIAYLDATSYETLYTQGIQTIVNDLNPTETFAISTSPFPLAWHRDIIQYVDPNLAPIAPALSNTRRVQAQTWTLPLDGQSDMTWSWQTVSVLIDEDDSGAS